MSGSIAQIRTAEIRAYSVNRIGIENYLLDVDWKLDLWDVVGDVTLQGLEIDRLPHCSGHLSGCIQGEIEV